jgi:DNA-binding MarR family transcriptional regulator
MTPVDHSRSCAVVASRRDCADRHGQAPAECLRPPPRRARPQPQPASLLAFVNDFGGTNQTELAELVGVGRASCGAMIDQLEARGLVTRNPDPHDRRVWLVGITDEGSALVQRFYAVDECFRQEIRHGISREERQQLATLLERLGTNVDAILQTPNPQKKSSVSDRSE